MSAERIAKLIPGEYRKEILELNMIDTAQALSTDTTMHYLAVVWKNYIENEFTADCNLCLARVLKNMKNIKPILVQMEKDYRLIRETLEGIEQEFDDNSLIPITIKKQIPGDEKL